MPSCPHLSNCQLLHFVDKYFGTSMNHAHGAVGRPINPSWGGPIELFLVPASAPRLV